MAVTIGGVTLENLQAQPFGYEATDTRNGLTARQWTIQGLVTGDEWLDLLAVYDAWRNAKILEDPVEISQAVGATVSFSGTGYGGQTWTSVACWFSEPPQGSQAGSMVSLACSLSDATQAVQVVVKEAANEGTSGDGLTFGTIVLNGVTITLTKDPDVFLDTPTLDLTASGKHYVTGSTTAVYGKEIEGEIVGTDKNALRTWYVNTMQANPVVGSYYPTSPPVFEGFNKLVGGTPVLYYTVTMSLAIVL